MSKKLNILIIEDSVEDVMLLVRELSKAGYEVFHERVETAEAMRALLAEKNWDVIISDHAMPHFNSIGALEVLKESGKDIPFIIVSGSIGEETAVAVMKAGAHDYIMKDNLMRLAPAIERELAEADVRRKRKITEERLHQSEVRYRMLFEGMMDAFALLEYVDGGKDSPVDFLHIDLNYSYAAILGSKREMIIGSTMREIYPRVGEDLLEHYRNIVLTGEPDHFEYYSRSTRRYFEISAYRPREGHVAAIIRDISLRKIAAEQNDLMTYILETINREDNTQTIIQDIISLMKYHYGFDAAGVRLSLEGDYPYYLSDGFSDNFRTTENFLCARDDKGEVIIGDDGKPILKCLCGLVLTGRTDAAAPYFTKGGSFWANDISVIPAASDESIKNAGLRGRCALEGYKSVALIPLRSGDEITGLLQFNSFHKNVFNPDLIEFFESVGLTVGIAIKRRRIEDDIRENEEKFHQLFNVESDSIFLIDNETGEILEVNESAAALYGYNREEFLRMKNTDLSAEPDLTRQVMADKATFISVRYHRKKDGTVFPVEIAVSHITRNRRAVHIAAIRDITERMRAEEALRKSEEQYRLIADNMSDSIWLMDMNFKYTFATPSLARDFGFTMEELNEMPMSQTITPDSFSRIQEVMAEELTPERLADRTVVISRTVEMEFVRSDGTTFWGEVSYELIRDAGGKPKAILGVARNITMRKQTEDALRESEEKYRTLVENLNDVIYTLDPGGIVTYISSGSIRLFNYVPEEVIGRHFKDFIYPDDYQAVYEQFMKTVAGEETALEYRVVDRNNVIHYIRTSVRPVVVNGRVVALNGILIDTTDRRKVLDALRESEERLRITLEATQIGIWDWDLVHDRWYASPIYYSMLGYEPVEGASDRGEWLRRVHPDDRPVVEDRINDVLIRKSSNYHYEARMLHVDGSYRWISILGYVVESDAAGIATRMLGIRMDITERKLAEEAIRQSQRFAQSTVNALDANIAILDGSGEIISVNSAWRIFAFNNMSNPIDVFEGVNYLTVCDTAKGNNSEGAAEFAAGIRAVMKGEIDSYTQEYPCHSPAVKRWFIGKVNRFPGEGELRLVVSHTNITERMLAEEKISASLREKELLLREIHHRVKNNMQVISSLMGLQSTYLRRGGDILSVFNDMQNRIKSMAIVHEKLYLSDDLSKIDFKDYITSLVATVIQSLNYDPDHISINIDVAPLSLGIDIAVPCGLILNELITNAYKYAFAGRDRGVITVTMDMADEQTYRLSVRDDGVGLPAEFNADTSGSLGMRLVRILTSQIGGGIAIKIDKGTEFVVTFPREMEDVK